MYCANCGTKLEKGTRFCMNCGTRIEGEMAETVVVVEDALCPETEEVTEWDGTGRFCNHCGAEAEAEEEVCRFCEHLIDGGDLSNSFESDNREELIGERMDLNTNANSTKENEKSTSSNIKTIIRFLLILALVCFFFPFTMVSCSGDELTLSGFEMMTATTQQDVELDEEYPPNVHLIVTFAVGMIALVCAYAIKKDGERAMLGSGACSAISAVFLFLFRTTFFNYYNLTDYRNYVRVEFLWGWYFCLMMYIIACVLAFYKYTVKRTANDYRTTE